MGTLALKGVGRYDALAERFVESERKGSRVFVEGEMHARDWTNPKNRRDTRVFYSIIANRIERVGRDGKVEHMQRELALGMVQE